MRLAGGLNWWAPAPLRRLHDRFGIAESQPETHPVVDPHEQGPLSGRERPLVGAEPEHH
jgi:RND superfamily putative drug exporter